MSEHKKNLVVISNLGGYLHGDAFVVFIIKNNQLYFPVTNFLLVIYFIKI